MGGYLRTNFKRTGQISLYAMAGGYPKTSYAGGAGLNRPYQGFIMGSLVASGSAIGVSAYGAMSAWFGGGLFDSGYQIIPGGFQVRVNTASTPAAGSGQGPYMYPSISGSIFYVWTAGSTASTPASAAYTTVFSWWGFISSSP